MKDVTETGADSRIRDRAEIGTEADLLAGLRCGDETAYRVLVERFGPRMYAVAKRFLGNADAEDCVQDALINVVRGIAAFEGRSALSTWIHRIVVTSALDHLRKKKRDRAVDQIDDLLPRYGRNGARQLLSEGPASLAVDLTAATRIRDLVDRLPDDARNVFLLRDVEGHSTDETAALLGINGPAVRTRLHRARAALRTLLEQERTI